MSDKVIVSKQITDLIEVYNNRRDAAVKLGTFYGCGSKNLDGKIEMMNDFIMDLEVLLK